MLSDSEDEEGASPKKTKALSDSENEGEEGGSPKKKSDDEKEKTDQEGQDKQNDVQIVHDDGEDSDEGIDRDAM